MFKNREIICFCFIITVLLCMSSAAYAQPRTITGTVYGSYELVTDDGDVYVVIADDKGDELTELDGNRVRVTGLVDELNGEYVITVTGFKVLTDDLQEQDQEEEPLEEDIPVDETKE